MKRYFLYNKYMSTQTKHQWKIRIISTLMGWAVAFMIVYSILLVFGSQLRKLPQAVDALIISGILVTLMGNFVMPWINQIVSKHL